MTKQEKSYQSELKRINTRISAIAKQFGTESYYYKKTIAQFQTKQFKDLVHYTNKGVIQLNTNVASIRNKNREYLTNIARKNVKTISRIRQELGMEGREKVADVVKERERKTATEERLKSKIQFLYDNYTESEQEEIAPDLFRSKGKLTNEQIDDIMVDIERKRITYELEYSDIPEDRKEEITEIIKNTDDLDLLESLDFKNDNPFED